jgi:hypothetical protein
MRYPKVENWTKLHSDSIIIRIDRLFDKYEKYSNIDDNGNETSKIANDSYLEMVRLWNMIPVEHRPKNRNIF